MPTYEYACTSCGTHVEVYQRFSEDPLTVCGVCGGQLKKVFHPAGILFKGSGFYATDSRSKSRGRSGGDGEKAPEKAGAATGSASPGDGGGSSSGGETSGSKGDGATRKGSTAAAKTAKEKSA